MQLTLMTVCVFESFLPTTYYYYHWQCPLILVRLRQCFWQTLVLLALLWPGQLRLTSPTTESLTLFWFWQTWSLDFRPSTSLFLLQRFPTPLLGWKNLVLMAVMFYLSASMDYSQFQFQLLLTLWQQVKFVNQFQQFALIFYSSRGVSYLAWRSSNY